MLISDGILTVLQSASKALTALQQEDGSFLSRSSKDPENFSNAVVYEAAFATSIILECCNSISSVPVLEDTRKRAANFLLHQRSEAWSWNYWRRGSKEESEMPYPDDLDDTFCALSALTRFNSEICNGQALAKITQLLTAVETKPGGPYKTWLVSKTITDANWHDVDLVVNSNVAYFLKLQGVTLELLRAYLETSIVSSAFISPYYPSWHAPVYFLSRAYSGVLGSKIIEYILSRQEPNGAWVNPLCTAMCVTALLRLGATREVVTRSLEYIVSTMGPNNLWPAYACWVDPALRGVKYYGGSPALTSAFCIEALSIYSAPTPVVLPAARVRVGKVDEFADKVIHLAKARFELLDKSLKDEAVNFVQVIANKDSGIVRLPYLVAGSIRGKSTPINKDVLLNLGLANLYGWMAYDIFDDVLDSATRISSVPLATIALREFVSLYQHVMQNVPDFAQTFNVVMDTLDSANSWEQSTCKIVRTGNTLQLPDTLPYESNIAKLGEKSLGHALSPLIILRLAGFQGDAESNVQIFFKHYLIARQLHDDAHDWEEDLRGGRINGASNTLFLNWLRKGYGKIIDMERDITKLRLLFWSESIPQIAREIEDHVQHAKRAISQVSELDPTVFLQMLVSVEKGAEKALNRSASTVAFIEEYRQVSGIFESL